MVCLHMNRAFRPQLLEAFRIASPLAPSTLDRQPKLFPQIIVNYQVPQNQHLQNSIKTNSFNSFAINTYKKPGGGGVTVNHTLFHPRDAKTDVADITNL
jgi:hypothetical protein